MQTDDMVNGVVTGVSNTKVFSFFTPYQDTDDFTATAVVPAISTFVFAATDTLFPLAAVIAAGVTIGSLIAAATFFLLKEDSQVDFYLDMATTAIVAMGLYCVVTMVSLFAAVASTLSLLTRAGATLCGQLQQLFSSSDDGTVEHVFEETDLVETEQGSALSLN